MVLNLYIENNVYFLNNEKCICAYNLPCLLKVNMFYKSEFKSGKELFFAVFLVRPFFFFDKHLRAYRCQVFLQKISFNLYPYEKVLISLFSR